MNGSRPRPETFERRHTRETFADAAKRLENHSIEVLHCDGLYRHYRCTNNGSWNDGFSIVTWPGSLMYTGDMGEYLFQRTDDMIAWMRDSLGSHHYVAEKCVAHGNVRTGSAVTEFRIEVLEEVLAERFQDAEENESTAEVNDIREKLAEIRDALDEDHRDPAFAYQAISDSGLWDGCAFQSCETFTYRFLWCLRALRWFVDTLDSGKAP